MGHSSRHCGKRPHHLLISGLVMLLITLYSFVADKPPVKVGGLPSMQQADFFFFFFGVKEQQAD